MSTLKKFKYTPGASSVDSPKLFYADNVKAMLLFHKKDAKGGSFQLLEDAIIPWFNTNKNLKTEKKEPLKLKKGEKCYYFSSFTHTADLRPGNCYYLHNISYGPYLDKKTNKYKTGINYKGIELISGNDCESEHIIKTIPFQSRSFDINADVLVGDYYEGKPSDEDGVDNYRTILMKLCPTQTYLEEQAKTNDDVIYITPLIANPRDTSIYVHVPYDPLGKGELPITPGLTGALTGSSVKEKAQWLVWQKGKYYQVAFDLWGETIERFMFHDGAWPELARYLHNGLFGTIYCAVDKKKTGALKQAEVEDGISGRFTCTNIAIEFDLRSILELKGIRLEKWESLVKLEPYILTPDGKNIKAVFDIPLDIILYSKNAVNVCGFSGNFDKLIESPYVKYYVLPNVPRGNIMNGTKPDDMDNDEFVLSKLLDEKTFSDEQCKIVLMFAVLSSDAPPNLRISSLLESSIKPDFNLEKPRRELKIVN